MTSTFNASNVLHNSLAHFVASTIGVGLLASWAGILGSATLGDEHNSKSIATLGLVGGAIVGAGCSLISSTSTFCKSRARSRAPVIIELKTSPIPNTNPSLNRQSRRLRFNNESKANNYSLCKFFKTVMPPSAAAIASSILGTMIGYFIFKPTEISLSGTTLAPATGAAITAGLATITYAFYLLCKTKAAQDCREAINCDSNSRPSPIARV